MRLIQAGGVVEGPLAILACQADGLRVTRRFWLMHAVVPAVALVPAFLLVRVTGADFRLAHVLFYDAPSGTWLGSSAWWADLVHEGGRGFIESVAASAVLVFIGVWLFPRWSQLRPQAAFVAIAIGLSTGIVGLLKQVTNVDCPWDLTEFGGAHAFVSLFGHRAPGLPRVECFPGAHSAAGFALICFYFALRDRQPRAAAAALVGGLLTGGVFGYVQEARGAHFLSHDLTSGAIVWYVQLTLYVLFARRLRSSPAYLIDPIPIRPAEQGAPWPRANSTCPTRLLKNP